MRTRLTCLLMFLLLIVLAGAMPDESEAGGANTAGQCDVQVTNPAGGSIALRGTIAVDMYDSTQFPGCPNSCPPQATGDVIVRLSRGGSEVFFRSRQTLPLASNTQPDYLATLCQIIQDSTLKTAILQQLAPTKSSLVIQSSSVQDYDGPPNVNDAPTSMFVPNVSDLNRHIISISDVTIYAQ